MKIAVVTGASSGMGEQFVRFLDRDEQFDEIWVIARRKERLESIFTDCRAKIRAIPLDLTRPESIDAYASLLKAENPEVSVLVNASGFGHFGAFADFPAEPQLEMIDLNCRALTAITWQTIPYLVRGSRVYQVDSLSSFQPVPYICVYGATKAYVLSFSRALNVELRGRGIRVMAVCPGWVKTDFFDRAVTDNTITYYNRFYTAEQVVIRALKDMKRGRDVSICGFPVRAQVFATKLLPHKLIMKIWCNQQKIKD